MLHDFADQYGIVIVTGLAALVVAGIVLLFTDTGISLESAAGESEPQTAVGAEDPDHAPVDRRGRRYLEVYHALSVSPRADLDPIPVASEQHEASEPALPWPQNVRAAKATKLSK